MKLKGLFLLFGVLFLSAQDAMPQSVLGTLRGIVTDQSGAVIPGARVTVISQDTDELLSTTTNANGEYVCALLPAGRHRIEIEVKGFVRESRVVEVQINQQVRLDLSLSTQPSKEVVEIVEPPELLNRADGAVRTFFENQQIVNLPLDGRNFYELTLLVPGAAPAAPGSAGSVRGELALNVDGGREDANLFLLDGVFNSDPKLNGVGVTPPVDAIQEFEVLTHNFDASFGRNTGGQVNVVLKRGSNAWHGSVYEFFRNAALDARNHFAPAGTPDPKYQRNQFGFSLGGPIRKEHTFFFADYEGRVVREGITQLTTVPTMAERNGDFSALPPQFQPIDFFTGLPFPGGVIPLNRQDPIGRAIAALYPQPNRAGAANFVSSPTQRDNEHHFDARVDQRLGNRGNLSARYSFSDRDLFEPFAGPTFARVPGYGNRVPRRGQNLSLNHTHSFAPHLLNEARFAYSRVSIGVLQQNQGNSINQQVGMPNLSTKPRDFGLSFINVTGFTPLGDEFNNPQRSASNTFQAVDHATWLNGRQEVKFGFEFRAIQQNGFRDVQSRGFLNFLGAFTFNPLADLLIGAPTITGGAVLDNPQHLRTRSWSFFVQDNWRVRSNLTLTAGLRYEYNQPPFDTGNRANIYDPAAGTLVRAGTGGVPRAGSTSDKNNFGPRVGLAWTMGPQKNTVLRAGYGIYFDQGSLAPGEGLYFNAPYFDFRLFFPLPGLPLTLSNPFPGFSGFFPITLPQSALAFQRNLRTPYTQHWSLNVQRELGRGRVFELGYVGTKGTRLLTARDINQPAASPVIPNLRPNPAFDDIDEQESRANSTYHALQARFQQAYGFGLSLLASYTWSKSLDDASSFFTSAGDPNFPQDSNNLRAERGRSGFDVRQRFSLAYTYSLPFGRGSKTFAADGWRQAVFGNWQTMGIITLQDGRPFTVALLSSVDNSNTGRSILGFGANDRPNLVGNPGVPQPAATAWFNAAAFALPPFGSFGNARRNILEGPGLATVNFSLIKNIPATEKLNVQFRTEFFNVFNRTNLDQPDNFFGSATFGQVLSAQAPRHLQFGLKLVF